MSYEGFGLFRFDLYAKCAASAEITTSRPLTAELRPFRPLARRLSASAQVGCGNPIRCRSCAPSTSTRPAAARATSRDISRSTAGTRATCPCARTRTRTAMYPHALSDVPARTECCTHTHEGHATACTSTSDV
eukprot:6185206-Pleurochrysis_carterae.AAC.1